MSEGAPASLSPLLFAEDVRIDVDGVPTCDGVSFLTKGDRVLVLGAPRALFLSASGLLPVVRGTLEVVGVPADQAIEKQLVASCPLDPPVPPKWTPLEYATWSARLAGHTKADARANAADALEAVGLAAFANAELGRTVPHARRATVLAAAIATGAPVILVEDPLADLAEEIAEGYATLMCGALERRRFIVFAGSIPLTSPLARAADEAVVVTSSRLDAQGSPAEIAAEARRFVARVHGPVDVLTTRLVAAGVHVEARGGDVVLDLGETMSTWQLLAMCAEAKVTVLELRAVARALA